MNPKDALDSFSLQMAITPLRMLRDWCMDETLVAFSGDPEKQFESLRDKITTIIMESGLFNIGTSTPEQRLEWIAGLDKLEKMVGLSSFPIHTSVDRGGTH